jgi:uncharacterized protein YlaI
MSENEAHRRIWNDPDVKLERCERSSEELAYDKPKRCEACGKVLTREEVREHPCLCDDCGARIDRETDEKLEEERFGWFE